MEPAPNGEEASDSLNYFICTLGQAASINGISPHKFKTINEFIDVQAERVPGLPAVAFPIPQDKDQIWSSVVLSKLLISSIRAHILIPGFSIRRAS